MSLMTLISCPFDYSMNRVDYKVQILKTKIQRTQKFWDVIPLGTHH